VIENHLKKTKSQVLVGDKVTYADLSFVPWFWLLPALLGEGFEKEWESSYPEAWAWYQRLSERKAVSEAKAERAEAMSKGH
jgi:glutathione S-transferase